MSEQEKKKIIIDLSQIYLDTPRLLLRPWWESDLEDFYAYASVPGVGEMAGWPHHESLDDTRRVLSMFMEEKNVWAIVLKEENRVIGSLGLHRSWANEEKHYPRDRILEIGYVLSKDHWGKGLMPEAVKRVLRFCFDQLYLDAVTVGHFTDNSQSRRVIEKCGFTLCQKAQYASQYDLPPQEEMQYILWREDMK